MQQPLRVWMIGSHLGVTGRALRASSSEAADATVGVTALSLIDAAADVTLSTDCICTVLHDDGSFGVLAASNNGTLLLWRDAQQPAVAPLTTALPDGVGRPTCVVYADAGRDAYALVGTSRGALFAVQLRDESGVAALSLRRFVAPCDLSLIRTHRISCPH